MSIPADSSFLSTYKFHPVIHLEPGYEIYDFTQGYDPNRKRSSAYGIGKYNEHRPTMYSTELFRKTGEEQRDVHVGIDLSAPEGTEVFAFFEGEVFATAIHPALGDYGGTIITQHTFDGGTLWALYGHLSHRSTKNVRVGQKIMAGDVLGWLGNKDENGGWNPHLHFQLSWERPINCDLPGAVRLSDRAKALLIYPDPRLVLGALY